MKKGALLVYAAALLLIVQSCMAPKNTSNFTLTGGSFGGIYHKLDIPYEQSDAAYVVSERWGIRLESGGCVMSNEISRERSRSNREAEANIRRKYRYGWKKRFRNEVVAEYRKQRQQTKKG